MSSASWNSHRVEFCVHVYAHTGGRLLAAAKACARQGITSLGHLCSTLTWAHEELGPFMQVDVLGGTVSLLACFQLHQFSSLALKSSKALPAQSLRTMLKRERLCNKCGCHGGSKAHLPFGCRLRSQLRAACPPHWYTHGRSNPQFIDPTPEPERRCMVRFIFSSASPAAAAAAAAAAALAGAGAGAMASPAAAPASALVLACADWQPLEAPCLSRPACLLAHGSLCSRPQPLRCRVLAAALAAADVPAAPPLTQAPSGAGVAGCGVWVARVVDSQAHKT